jgi:hypothetical protein
VRRIYSRLVSVENRCANTIPRTDGIIFIQITLNEGRTLELKTAFYQNLAERLHGELGVRVEDVFINLVEVKKENWSFNPVTHGGWSDAINPVSLRR